MPDWETLGLFANPLIRMRFEDVQPVVDAFYQEVHAQQADIQHNQEEGDQHGLLNHYGNYTDLLASHPSFQSLKERLEERASFAYRELLNFHKSGPMKVLNAWFNLAQPGASQAKHSHANCLLSGTLYLHTDENTSITFYHPLSTGSLHHELYDQAVQSTNQYGLRYHYTQVEVTASAGDCLFWPSHLYHGYTNNRTPDRLSLSFNMMPERLNTVYQISPSN